MAGGARPEIHESVLELIGETPLVRLSRLDPGLRTPLVAKVEFLNPGGSVKDRPAVAMIDAAERAGLLRPGGTIVEPTSGNTGLGLAMVAALRGYKVIAVMPDKMSREKIDTLRAFGAEVVVCPTAVEPDSPRSYYRVADRLTEEIDGAFQPNQYFNRANPEAHYRSTGPEIWRQTGGRVTHFVAGVGTGGTLSGVGRYLKERNPAVEIVGADPEGSIYSGGPVHPYRVEGIGEDFWPESLDRDVIDRYITVSDRDSFGAARELVAREGLFAGGSTGTALCAALAVARELDDPEAMVVTLIPDGGRPYVSKVFNDAWMREHGYLDGGERQTVGELARERDGAAPILSVTSHDQVAQALELMREHGISQLPVRSVEDDRAFVGRVSERGLLWASADHPGILGEPVTEVLEPPLPEVSVDDPADDAIRILREDAPAVIVVERGAPISILTAVDIVEALNR
ncbi:MAG TPA: cystathionine beta-synthase [Solirubrobacterales bacterium]|nr:cystathionine beta-synthase [Solirubrobacterales bacterium]